MEIISRKLYADKVDAWIGKGQIIVLTGQRRVGKSYILKDFMERHKTEADTNIIYINKEKKEFDSIRTYEELNGYIDSHFIAGVHNYILIDEIQEIEGWEKTVRSFRLEDNTDVIVTGSNAKMLSSELSTLIGGRYVEIYVQSLSYMEFLQFNNLADSDGSLSLYLEYGGLPGLRKIGIYDEEHVLDYLRSVFNTIMLKDVIEKNNIRNISFLNNLIQFFADTTGKLNSANSISKYMKSQGQEISTNAVLAYREYFGQAYLLSKVSRYDIHGKKIFDSNEKVYFGDLGLRNVIVGGDRDGDIEKVIETVIYQHLVRLGYQVYVGQLNVGEIDFVCNKSNSRVYVQASYLIADQDTREREFGRLKAIDDNYPKYVISMNPLLKVSDYDGIIHLHLREFLKMTDL